MDKSLIYGEFINRSTGETIILEGKNNKKNKDKFTFLENTRFFNKMLTLLKNESCEVVSYDKK